MRNKLIGKIAITFYIAVLAAIACLGVCDFFIPDELSVYTGEDVSDCINIPFIEFSEPSITVSSNGSKAINVSSQASVLGGVKLKDVEVNVFDKIKLYPGGMPFGVKIYTKGLLVVGISEVESEGKVFNPAGESGLRVKDIIEKVNGKETDTIVDFSKEIESSGGSDISLTVIRGGREMEFSLKPILSSADGKYKAGLWVRDSTAGIGTVTYINPADNTFAGLGHGICDADTGEIMPLKNGDVVNVTISGITKGLPGTPGELNGYFNSGKSGELLMNTNTGVYGQLDSIPNALVSAPLPIALKREIKEGYAYIYSTVGDKIEKYDVEIQSINKNSSENKNFIIKVTDKKLLEKTGGIVQGMSGSPIIQDGRIIGAVTHVLINDPTRGYGIFIENMLKTPQNNGELGHAA